MARLAVAALSVALASGGIACSREAGDTLPVASIGGDFTLTDHDGSEFALASQRGKVVLIFFGYTFCPDVCPTTLSKLTSVTRTLGDDRAKVKTLYITVDPERDTPAVLKADLEGFDLDATGLTGTREAIDRVVRQYGAKYEFIPQPESAIKYTVNHSTTLYALDGQGRVRIEFPYEATVDQIVAGVRRIMAEGN
jgi:protein SCO1/2